MPASVPFPPTLQVAWSRGGMREGGGHPRIHPKLNILILTYQPPHCNTAEGGTCVPNSLRSFSNGGSSPLVSAHGALNPMQHWTGVWRPSKPDPLSTHGLSPAGCVPTALFSCCKVKRRSYLLKKVHQGSTQMVYPTERTLLLSQPCPRSPGSASVRGPGVPRDVSAQRTQPFLLQR